MADITRWELKMRTVDITEFSLLGVTTVDPKLVWKGKDKEGRSDWDKLKGLAAEGWELVSVTPITVAPNSGQTFTLLYTFKRPLP